MLNLALSYMNDVVSFIGQQKYIELIKNKVRFETIQHKNYGT